MFQDMLRIGRGRGMELEGTTKRNQKSCAGIQADAPKIPEVRKKMMNKKIPMRQCVGCGEMKGKKEMMRVLKTPEGPIVLDVTGRKNGRGAYLCKNLDCLKKAEKNKGLERSFKMSIPKEVYENLEKEFGESETE